ncbi:MAG: beta-N-acetylhexosaminidase [Bacteroidaceae bacterium]|nr:beta-N-acetylhexosaminidase [Bacteroidaceae bacterium]
MTRPFLRCIVALCAAMLLPLPTNAQTADYRVIPLPTSIVADTTRTFALNDGMGIAYDSSNPDISRNAQFLKQWVAEVAGVQLQLTPDNKKAAIQLAIRKAPAKTTKKAKALADMTPQELAAYDITVDARGIRITANTDEGLFHAAQTLRKSLLAAKAPVRMPFATIHDQPRFEYRGVHLDVARHYFSVPVVKQYIDLMAMHGCNQLHWHITEDQGWRFEVKALPELARKGSIREQTVIGRNTGVYDGQRYGGYYTQEECRELVNYAAQRYVNIIPEIDLPGHMMGALHVFPNLGCTGGPYPVWPHWGVSREVLCAGNPETLTFLKTVLGELCDVFPSKYIHIGGDECPKQRWKQCPKCQAKAQELGLTDDGQHSVENQLQTWINHEMEAFLRERGRDMIGWDEVLEGGLTESGIVMSWRGVKGGIAAAREKHRVIMSPNSHCYIDYYQLKEQWNQPEGIGGYLPTSKVYGYEPLSDELTDEEKSYILGPQVNLWTEYVAFPQHLFYMLLPRLDAISEVQWSQPGQKDFDDFCRRLPRMKRLYDSLGINYCHAIE